MESCIFFDGRALRVYGEQKGEKSRTRWDGSSSQGAVIVSKRRRDKERLKEEGECLGRP